jgi:4-alpha-glucanotransferase
VSATTAREHSSIARRSAGVLLHVTSLPGPHGNGDLGPAARRFIDFLADAGQAWWQVLPVNPVGPGNSPYSGASAFSGNPLLISLEDLVEDGLLQPADVAFELDGKRADYPAAARLRTSALRKAFAEHQRRPRRLARELERFREQAAYWLPDYALYMALKGAHDGQSWTQWPRPLMRREAAALRRARRELQAEIDYHELVQLLFHRQWARLREHGAARGVGLIGDAPIFIAHESADVWAHAPLFMLDRTGQPSHVAGVPPDYFCKTGQRWGNPLYRWRALQQSGFRWWIERFRCLLGHFDAVRLDHFIGFVRYWQVPASEATAEHGTWQPAPGRALFAAVRRALGATPFIAEDLGEVTAAVRELRDELGLPGMRILQFAFGGDTQAAEFLPHRYLRNSVAYTGTHDNDTFVGWFDDPGAPDAPRSKRQAAKERRAATAYLAGPLARELPGEVHWEAIRALYASVANTALVPLQDILGLGNEARMNMPGTALGNWEWRVNERALSPKLARTLASLAQTYGRAEASQAPSPGAKAGKSVSSSSRPRGRLEPAA